MYQRAAFLFRQVTYDLRSGLLLRPGVITASLAALSAVLVRVDGLPGFERAVSRHMPGAFAGEPGAAQAMLGIIAGSMMTVVSIVYSVLVMALTLASMQFSPRVLAGLLRDRQSQTTLGLFVGTFTYCLLVLRVVRGDPTPFVPVLSVTGAIVLALVCLAWLLYFIHHIGHMIQANFLVDSIAGETELIIAATFPERLEPGKAAPAGAVLAGAAPVGVVPVAAAPVGVVPVGVVPVAAAPAGAVLAGAAPVGVVPAGAVQVGAVPNEVVPAGAVPVGAVPVGAVPAGAVQVGAVPNEAVPDCPRDAVPVPAPASGYVQLLDEERLAAIARQYDLCIYMHRGIGEFAVEDRPLVFVTPGERASLEVLQACAAAYDLGPVRTMQNDVEYGVRQVVDIALKAISPAVNDPSTAVTCIDHLSRLLCRLATRRIPSSLVRDPAGRLRLVMRRASFRSVLDLAFTQLRQYSRTDMAVTLRMIRALTEIAAVVQVPGDLQRISEHARLMEAEARRNFIDLDCQEMQSRLEVLAEILRGRMGEQGEVAS